MILRIAAEMVANPAVCRPLLEVGYVPMTRTTFYDPFRPFLNNAKNAVRGTIPELRLPDSIEIRSA